MALNKHQQLAKKIQQMQIDHEKHFKKVDEQVNRVQFYFYEKCNHIGRPFIKEEALKAMIKTSSVGTIRYFANQQLRDECELKGMMGLFLKLHRYPRSKTYISSKDAEPGDKWVVQWGVETRLPSANRYLEEKSRFLAFLYASSLTELKDVPFWFEGEERADSFCYTLNCIEDEIRADRILEQNLFKPAYQIYEETVVKWREEQCTNDMVPETESKAPFSTDFAPKKTDTLQRAYGRVRESMKTGKYRNYQGLRGMWLKRIKEEVLRGVAWAEERMVVFFDQWDKRLFCPDNSPAIILDNSPILVNKNGRDQGRGVDHKTASRFIQYFAEEFVKDPQKKHFGEAACFLWVCIHISSENHTESLTLKDVEALNSQQLEDELFTIVFGDIRVEISEGLTSLLKELKGDGTGVRRRSLFENLKLPHLRRMLKKASKILQPDNPIAISPEAFLVFPHIFEGIRMSKMERKACRIEEHELKYHLSPSREEVLDQLKKAASF